MDDSSELLPVVYELLRNFAKSRFPQNDSLYGTELVHEAYLRVANGKDKWESKAHFFGAVRLAMRNAVVDHLRRKSTQKHGGNVEQVSLEIQEPAEEQVLPEIIALSDAIDELAKQDPRAANVVTLKFFGCLTEAEIAEELEISRRTVSREWNYAKSWLRNAMSSE